MMFARARIVISVAALVAITAIVTALSAGAPSYTLPLDQSPEPTQWWAYKPLNRSPLPAVANANWPRNPIDAFICAKLDKAGLKPAGPADRVALIRRATYDLIGLPPTPAEVDAFVADTADDAFDKVIDRLLAMPQYGEKWGRHWLDLVRYAETNGYERDGTKPFAWRYRDYVIGSFNSDKPYDQFIREQLAGDELVPRSADATIATGYFRLGLWDDEPADPPLARYDELDDFVTTTCQVFLGMTVNCARCHDHKADPIPQADYYRMLAFFQDIPRFGDRSMSEKHVLTDIGNPAHLAEDDERRTAAAEQLERVNAELAMIEQAGIAKMSPADQRATEGPQRNRILREKLRLYLSDDEARRYDTLRRELVELRKSIDSARNLALSVNNCMVHPPETHILARGSPHAPGALVEPGFPRAIGGGAPTIPAPAGDARSSGRRTVLANWIASRDNPLTARVIANRLWQHHFGRGLVRTANDFGKLGERPTHPELLDWLAAEICDPSIDATARGTQIATNQATAAWTLKRMHKLIMRSAAYQMSSQDDPDGLRVDPSNELFWRFDMRRLTAEELRDSILAVNGAINLKLGGPSIYTEVPAAVLHTASRPDQAWGKSPIDEQNRRSVYIFVKRSLIEPMLNTFDIPDPDSSCAVRFATTVPTQSLTAINSEFFNRESLVFADRLRREAGDSLEAQFRLGLRLLVGRTPQPGEIDRCVQLFRDLREQDGLSPGAAMKSVCLMLLNLNEFVYLD